jgi:response regulator NasT
VVAVHRRALSIAIIDENPVRAATLEEGLREAGYVSITRIGEMTDLLTRIYALDPDVIVIDLENPSRDVLEQMFQVSRAVRRPVAMFVDQADSASIQAAIDAGVSSYVVDGLRKERIRPILDITISRFHAFARLQGELTAAKEALEDRKIIERAKGILMKGRQLSEKDAYALLRKAAMNQKRKLVDVAQSVVTAAQLLNEP